MIRFDVFIPSPALLYMSVAHCAAAERLVLPEAFNEPILLFSFPTHGLLQAFSSITEEYSWVVTCADDS
jgi:hypothetical protein